MKNVVSLNIEEDDYTCNVVDDVFPLAPLVVRCSYKSFCCAFCISLLEERVDYVCDLLVIKELPDPITRQDHYLVVWL